MDEQPPPARVAAPRTLIMEGPPPAREPFDPALLLEGRRPPPLPYATGPTVERAAPFDPAAHLGERARRGAFDLSTVKPITMTIGGVDMVAVPSSAYDDAVRRLAAQEQDRAGMLDLLLSLHAAEVVSTGQLVTATGLDHLDIAERVAAYAAGLPRLARAERAEDGTISGVIVEGQRFDVISEEHPDYGAAMNTLSGQGLDFVPTPEAARVDVAGDKSDENASEAHGAALDDGQSTEAHGAALDIAKPEKRPRKGSASHVVP